MKPSLAMNPSAQKPSIGRVVHYVDDTSFHRAAIITEVHEQGVAAAISAVSLCVFGPTSTEFKAHVPFHATEREGTWHWPEYVG